LQHLAARIFTKEQTGIAESRCFTKTFVGDPSRKRTSTEKQQVSSPNPYFPATEQ
jgi:hypothetical protein